MNEWFQAVILALIQGLSEFLPISSSAHLILPSQVMGWPDQGLAFDVAVHLGTLMAVVAYYRSDLMQLAAGSARLVFRGETNEQATLVLWLGLATIPAGLAGLLLNDWIELHLRSTVVIATSTLVFGLLLGLADRGPAARGSRVLELSLGIALVIGLAQALALIPGTSRSGITITAALFCGLSRQDSARFSFLLSIPLIAAAGGLMALDLIATQAAVPWGILLMATVVSGVTAWLCIGLFLRLLDRIGLMPFVIYRCLLAAVLFWLVWSATW